MTKRRLIIIAVIFIALGSYPSFVIGYTWLNVYKSDFKGGKHGPLDAYRHTLASAVVTYTTNEYAVKLATNIMERNDKNSNKMDIHNNNIGIQIGKNAKSFYDLKPEVHQSVSKGTVNTNNPNQTTWLPEKEWHEGLIW